MGKPHPHEPAPSDRSDEKKKRKRKRKRERTEAESTNKGRDLDDGGEGKGQMEIQRDGKHLNKRERKNGQGPNVGLVHQDEHNENLKHANIDPAAATGSEEAKMQVEVEATKKKGKHKKCESAGANVNIRTDGQIIKRVRERSLQKKVLRCYTRRIYNLNLVGYKTSKERCSLKSEWCLLCALRGHARSLSEHSSPTHPDPIIMHFEVIAGPAFKLNKDQDAFKLNKDQDAHEFMAHAIRKLQYDNLNKHNDKKVEAADTIINHIFGGELFSEVRCTACGYTSPKHEQMQDISVGIGLFPKSLEKCLQRDFDEKIHDYDCPKGESKEKKSTLSEEADEKDSKNKQKSRKGLVIEDMSEVALNGCKVSINYVAKLKDGTVLHSNGNGKPYKFILGLEKVIPGWNVGIEGMHLGDKRRLTVRPSMRKTGSKPPIGEEYKKSTIIYDVELVRIKTS